MSKNSECLGQEKVKLAGADLDPRLAVSYRRAMCDRLAPSGYHTVHSRDSMDRFNHK
jgi:hypothetical protein